MGREKEMTPVTVVVSLGTGVIPVKSLNEIDVYWPNIYQSVKGAQALGNVLVDQVRNDKLRYFLLYVVISFIFFLNLGYCF